MSLTTRHKRGRWITETWVNQSTIFR